MKKNYNFFESLLSAHKNDKVPVIAEVKAYTPSSGDLIKDRSIENIISLYEQSKMACISVVTGRWFKGTPDFLTRANKTTDLPLLRKDFIVTRKGLEQSKELGASAVLLTRQLVDISALNKLMDSALIMGITPFIEVGSMEEIAEIHVDQDAIIAVCNRDIKTQETDGGDIKKSLALAAAAKTTGAGLIVSASAIENSDQAKILLEAGYDGLLIGTAFLLAPELAEVLDDFYMKLKDVRVKKSQLISEKDNRLADRQTV